MTPSRLNSCQLLACLAAVLAPVTPRAEVPLSWDSTGHVTVPAIVNGRGPFPFILDTGADETGVYSWFARSLGLPKSKIRALSGATGSEETPGALLSTLTVDGRTLRNIDADTFPDRPDGAKLAGIAGVDLMRHRLVVIDFNCRTVSVRPIQSVTRGIVGTGATLVKAGSIRDGQQLTLPVTVNGAVGVAVLDSGARDTIINHEFASAAGIDPQSAAFRDGLPARGATMHSVSSRVGPIGTVHFAGITRQGVIARIIDLPYFRGAGLAGGPALNLGLDLLRGTRLTLDYSSRRFWLAPSSCASQLDSRAP